MVRFDLFYKSIVNVTTILQLVSQGKSKQTKMQRLTTIILRLKDRPEYTKRWLIHNLYDCFEYIICDGSSDNKNKQIIEPFLSDNIQYFKSAPDKNVGTYVKKMNRALKMVKTNFVIMADNDDFISHDGLLKSEAYLSEKKSAIAIQGKMKAVFEKNERFLLLSDTENWEHIENETWPNQLIKFSEGPQIHLFYALYRTEKLTAFWKLMLSAKVQNVFLIEIFNVFFTLAKGPVIFVSDATYIRQTNPITSVAKTYSDKHITQNERFGFVLNDCYSKQCQNFFALLEKETNFKKSEFMKMIRLYLLNNFVLNTHQDQLIKFVLHLRFFLDAKINSLKSFFIPKLEIDKILTIVGDKNGKKNI